MMWCNVKRSNRLISGSVSRNEPDDHAAFVEQKSTAVRPHLKSPCAILPVDLDDFLPRLLRDLRLL